MTQDVRSTQVAAAKKLSMRPEACRGYVFKKQGYYSDQLFGASLFPGGVFFFSHSLVFILHLLLSLLLLLFAYPSCCLPKIELPNTPLPVAGVGQRVFGRVHQ